MHGAKTQDWRPAAIVAQHLLILLGLALICTIIVDDLVEVVSRSQERRLLEACVFPALLDGICNPLLPILSPYYS
jgi:hypothetical protein